MKKGFLDSIHPRLKPGVYLSNPIIKKWLFISILALWLLALAFQILRSAPAADDLGVDFAALARALPHAGVVCAEVRVLAERAAKAPEPQPQTGWAW